MIERGSGNVFADVGFEDAENMLAKAKLALAIKDVIKARNLTQAMAADIMGMDQPKVSKIMSGRLTEFSTERMLNCLLRLGLDVDIVIHQTAGSPARSGTVSVAYR